jgi:integrase
MPPDMVPAVLLDQAREFLRRARSANTRRAYAADWRDFAAWCGGHGAAALPAAPETVTLYLAARAATCRVSTLSRRVTAISQAHLAAGFDSPAQAAVVRTVMKGIRREKGSVAAAKKPLLVEDLRVMVALQPGSLRGLRDRALLLVGFAGAFRRSELVALDWEDVEFTRAGLAVRIRRSKTDPEGQGRRVGIPHGRVSACCPVRALEAWRDEAGGDRGPVFHPVDRHGNLLPARLSDKAVARIVKRAVAAAGTDPADYAGHSLRAGFATAAAMGGASERAIMNQTGHRSLVVARRYIREGSLFRDNAFEKTGL